MHEVGRFLLLGGKDEPVDLGQLGQLVGEVHVPRGLHGVAEPFDGLVEPGLAGVGGRLDVHERPRLGVDPVDSAAHPHTRLGVAPEHGHLGDAVGEQRAHVGIVAEHFGHAAHGLDVAGQQGHEPAVVGVRAGFLGGLGAPVFRADLHNRVALAEDQRVPRVPKVPGGLVLPMGELVKVAAGRASEEHLGAAVGQRRGRGRARVIEGLGHVIEHAGLGHDERLHGHGQVGQVGGRQAGGQAHALPPTEGEHAGLADGLDDLTRDGVGAAVEGRERRGDGLPGLEGGYGLGEHGPVLGVGLGGLGGRVAGLEGHFFSLGDGLGRSVASYWAASHASTSARR